MDKKKAIKRFLLTLMWLGVAAGMGIIITAAMRVQEAGLCKGYEVKIEGFKADQLFTSEEQIIKLLKAATKGEIKGQPKSDFDLPVIEDLLEQSSWVYNADLYFDNNNILHAVVTERKPLARVFSNNGESFYIDEAGKHIPLSDKVSLDLPVFTGYPNGKILHASDSALIQNVIAVASYIKDDPFWNVQVAQIDIESCGADCWKMEMTPVVGNHKVELGDGSDIATKLHRLYLFYDQVLKNKGFDKYQKVDVQYDGQVIGVKGTYTKIDSLQLRKNIEGLLSSSRQSNEKLLMAPVMAYETAIPMDSVSDNGIAADSLLHSKSMEGNDSKENIEPKVVEKAANTLSVGTAIKPETVKAETKKSEPKKVADAKVKDGGKEAIKKNLVKKKPVVPSKTTDKKPIPKEASKLIENKKPIVKKESKPSEVKKVVAPNNEKRNVLESREEKKTVVNKPKEVKNPNPKPVAKKPEVKKSVSKPIEKKEPVTKPNKPVKKLENEKKKSG